MHHPDVNGDEWRWQLVKSWVEALDPDELEDKFREIVHQPETPCPHRHRTFRDAVEAYDAVPPEPQYEDGDDQ